MKLTDHASLRTSPDDAPRLAVLWWGLPAYAYSCVTALAKRIGLDRTWCGSLGNSPAYHAEALASGAVPVHAFPDRGDPKQVARDILASLEEFRPEVVVGSGWNLPMWRLVAERLRGQGVAVVVMADTPWLGTIRQAVRCVLGRRRLHRMADALWTPGARGYPVAKLAGYDDDRIWQHVYCCDAEMYGIGTEARLQAATSSGLWPRRFLFVGRLVPSKNLSGLLDGYARYAGTTPDPWSLTIIGDGREAGLVQAAPGVEWLRALPPTEVCRVMGESGCLVLPSTYEPWGVVAHEASCAGLPLILSGAVGAGPELLCDGYNGRGVNPRDPVDLANAMRWVSDHPAPWLLGQRSLDTSRRFSPQLWAEYLVTKSTELLATGHRSA